MSLVDKIRQRIDDAERDMRDILCEDFKQSLSLSSEEAMRRHVAALAEVMDSAPQRHNVQIVGITP